MTAKIIDGKLIASEICAKIKTEISARKLAPGLAVILVGNDKASEIYVRNKKKACAEVGIKNFDYALPENSAEKDVLKLVQKLNKDKKVHGILVQLPLPEHISQHKVIEAISPEKDVDGFHPANLGKLLTGHPHGLSFRPCTPLGIMALIDSTGVALAGKTAVVVGRSNIVGKPVALMLLERHVTVTVCHSKTGNLPELVKSADILVVAAGKPSFIKGDRIKNGAVVIDVGINRLENGSITGDVDFGLASERAGFITPVPGGVGPMTIAFLLKNVFASACAGQKTL